MRRLPLAAREADAGVVNAMLMYAGKQTRIFLFRMFIHDLGGKSDEIPCLSREPCQGACNTIHLPVGEFPAVEHLAAVIGDRLSQVHFLDGELYVRELPVYFRALRFGPN